MTADELLEKGIALLEEDPLAALSCFEKAHTLKDTPVIQSYLGMCIGTERGKVSYGIMLCTNAITLEPENQIHYLNLGKIFVKAGRRAEAIETFRKGLSFRDSVEIRRILDKLGTRKKPIIPFLHRDNPLNKYSGILLRRLRLR